MMTVNEFIDFYRDAYGTNKIPSSNLLQSSAAYLRGYAAGGGGNEEMEQIGSTLSNIAHLIMTLYTKGDQIR